MLSNLGSKRIGVFVFLFALNIVLGVYTHTHVVPSVQNADKMLRGLKAEIEEKREDIKRVRFDLSDLDGRKDDFNNVKDAGFFQNQDRRSAEIILNKIQELTNMVNATVRILPGALVEDSIATKLNYVVMESPISLELESLSDVDIFRYIYLLENYFPGHVTIQSINLNRQRRPDGSVLRAIALGEPVAMAKANVEVIWRTMVKQGQVKEEL